MAATYRTTDGHMVRSRAEVIIDNWLYTNDVEHTSSLMRATTSIVWFL
jgi:hypothetical protein